MKYSVIVLIFSAGCIGSVETEDSNTIQLGALLPFTGDMAAAGINIERSLLMAAEQMNKAGGVAGKQIEIASSDAPDATRGLRSAQSLVADPKLVGMLGPQVAEVFSGVEPLVADRDLYGILPSEMALSFNQNQAVRWFHMAPRTESVACAMAQGIYNDSRMHLLILATDDEYNQEFARTLLNAYLGISSMGKPTASLKVFNPHEWGDSINILSVLSDDIDTIALIAYPTTAAQVIQDWAVLDRKDTWYFGPALRTNVFLDNTPTGIIEGMKGFSAYIPEDRYSAFSARFFAYWDDLPMTDAFFYYDALAVSALAIEAAAVQSGTFPSNQSIREKILTVSRGPGITVTWDDLPGALAQVRAGQAVNYEGVSGHLNLTDQGYLESTIETINIWKVEDGRVRPYGMTTCTPQ